MTCDCFKFRKDLVDLTKDILIKGDEIPQWEVLEQFCSIYKNQLSQPHGNGFCLQEICSFLSSKLNGLSCRDMAISNFLVDLLGVLFYVTLCGRGHRQRLRIAPFLRDREAMKLIGALSCRGSYDFMKLLLNFGFLSSLPIDSFHLMQALEHEFATFITKITGYVPNMDIYSMGKNTVELLVKSNFYHSGDGESSKRMFLVVMALRGVNISIGNNNDPLIEDFIGSVRMYFSATRDALISVFEVRCILYASFRVINRLDVFDVYCQEFDKLMPECPAVTEPRSLSHLTRCQIRQDLHKSRLPLPSAIEQLLLPNILKSFLLGEVFEISRKKGNASPQKCVTRSQLELMMSGQ